MCLCSGVCGPESLLSSQLSATPVPSRPGTAQPPGPDTEEHLHQVQGVWIVDSR